MYTSLIYAGLIGFASVQAFCPQGCIALYDPVCGSDGKTYGNSCNLLMASCNSDTTITEVSKGECPTVEEEQCNSICPAVYQPVCGSDGITYGNACGLNAASCLVDGAITQVSEGECPTEPECDIFCTKEYMPVCGSDGVTYGNACTLQAASCLVDGAITQVSEGECAPECPNICPAVYQPVCGSDGITYSNACGLNAASCLVDGAITQVSEGECAPECSAICTLEYAPVCGSNGVTYGNMCQLESASCFADFEIMKLYDGQCCENRCAENEKEDVYCRGSNAQSSSQECSVLAAVDGQSFTCAWKPVEECDVCVQQCDNAGLTVCGSDGITYENSCVAEFRACISDEEISYVEGRCRRSSFTATTQLIILFCGSSSAIGAFIFSKYSRKSKVTAEFAV